MQTTFFDSYTTQTPLWYVGSKAKLVPHLKQYLVNMDLGSMVCPFIGGGAVELYLSSQDIQVHGSDNFHFLVNFWNQMIYNSSSLVDRVKYWWDDANGSTDFFSMIHNTEDPLEQAAFFWILNKQSYRGLTMASGNPSKSPVQVSFASFEKYRSFHSPNLSVHLMDYRDALAAHPTKEAYLDPPYPKKSKLYGDGTATEFDHKELRDILADRSTPWILCYSNEEYIRNLYKDFHINFIEFSYQFRLASLTKVDELIISNFEPEVISVRDSLYHKRQ